MTAFIQYLEVKSANGHTAPELLTVTLGIFYLPPTLEYVLICAIVKPRVRSSPEKEIDAPFCHVSTYIALDGDYILCIAVLCHAVFI